MATYPLRVVLFVGHKGPGTGAQDDPDTAYNEDEFDNAQKAACAIGADLLLRHHQPLVITGEGDDYLAERVRLAVKCRPDIAIACHFNAVEDERANGCEVLFHPANESAKALAESLASNVVATTGVSMRRQESRGAVPIENLAVLNGMQQHGIPTVILEPLFLSNPGDQQLLAAETYWRVLAQGVCDGINAWAAVWNVVHDK